MATIEQLVSDEGALRTALQGLIALVKQLQAGTGLSAQQQAEVDQLDASLQQDTADTTAAEQPPAPPVV